MKPSDHPEFFTRPPPEGRSRESTIRIDGRGRFWHEGQEVAHAGLAAGLHKWIGRHPIDGRYILSNGYDWTYFAVDDAPFFVVAVRGDSSGIMLTLSDRTEERLDAAEARIGHDEALYVRVKRAAPGGPYEAKLTPQAQASLAPWLVDADGPALQIGGAVVPIGRP